MQYLPNDNEVMVMVSQAFSVSGMTCGHCVQAVTDEITKLASVESVVVDLGTGMVTVSSGQSLDLELVAAAVVEAGYELMT